MGSVFMRTRKARHQGKEELSRDMSSHAEEASVNILGLLGNRSVCTWATVKSTLGPCCTTKSIKPDISQSATGRDDVFEKVVIDGHFNPPCVQAFSSDTTSKARTII
jgi:hypothetical protein